MSVSTFGYLRIRAYLQLPVAFRSLSRPSSAPCAKAFTLCSCSLELPCYILYNCCSLFFELLEFHKHFRLLILCEKTSFSFWIIFPPFGEIVSIFRWSFTLLLKKDQMLLKLISFNLFVLFSISVRFYSSIYFIRFSMIILRTSFEILVGSSGLEPPTSRLSGVRSNHLSYEPISYFGVSRFSRRWWRWWDSNPWPPACRAGALPTELHPHSLGFYFWVPFRSLKIEQQASHTRIFGFLTWPLVCRDFALLYEYEIS